MRDCFAFFSKTESAGVNVREQFHRKYDKKDSYLDMILNQPYFGKGSHQSEYNKETTLGIEKCVETKKNSSHNILVNLF